MAKVDDLLQRWTKQIVLTIVARMAHGFSPTANLAVKGITKSPNPESKNARKPTPTHGFLAQSNTCSRQITATDQSLPNSSRATRSHVPFWLVADEPGAHPMPECVGTRPTIETDAGCGRYESPP